VSSNTTSVRPLTLPSARGPLSSWVLETIRGSRTAPPTVPFSDSFDDDLQLALYCCYEPHFTALPEAVIDLEWDLDVLAFRHELEWVFEVGLRDVVGAVRSTADVRAAIPAMLEADDGPSLSRYMEARGTLDQLRDFVVHRSAYQLKEADGHTFGIPRLTGATKQLLAEIQAGEYGADGDDRVMHATLFAQTMRELGLDDRRNAYLDVQPGAALAISNLISMFGLHRRWRGALVGHLAVFEMTSVEPMGRYARALDRLGVSAAGRRFYDVHVLADAEHEVMALELASTLAEEEPRLTADVLFGAGCAIAAEQRFAGELLRGWGVDAARA
jgi:hypothetical protein